MANCGTYIFKSAVEFRQAAESLLECPEEAESIAQLAQLDFYGIPVNCQDVALVSTPPQLEDFVRKVSSGQVLVPGRSSRAGKGRYQW
eukprot:Skav218771  [mRNA]  locus=scaffold1372:337668:338249:- [translate_table: standard]